jgi:outer membrane protein OmpA-like peptidoglycan-associated protein
MRTHSFIFSALNVALVSASIMTAHAAEGDFYDPSNAASPSGKTVGYELYGTIGCPGRGLLDAPCIVETQVLEGVNFDFDKATLRPESHAILDKAAATLKKQGKTKVKVAGHTDSRGSDSYNLKLSQRRAETVRNYLIKKGVAADRLTAKGYGESRPIADNATKEGRFKNRRVELVTQ